MPLVSVIIPSHNRPGLLREAIDSVRNQTYSDWEIVIVDDGSQPPVDAESLHRDFGTQIQVVRNDQPMKQTFARYQGVEAATGDVVFHLDDDDLLAPNALEITLAILENDPSLEVVFLGVKGFGERAAVFEKEQSEALNKVLTMANGRQIQPNLIRFDSAIFEALLKSIPMAFQRSIAYRDTWNKISELRRQVYMLDSDIANEEQAMRRLQPSLADSEWALYATASSRTALLTTAVYLQRCEGQGYFSINSQREQAVLAGIEIKKHLLCAANKITEFKSHEPDIRKSMASEYFNQSYYYFHNGQRFPAYRALFNALKIRPAPSYLKFGLRMLLPRGRISD